MSAQRFYIAGDVEISIWEVINAVLMYGGVRRTGDLETFLWDQIVGPDFVSLTFCGLSVHLVEVCICSKIVDVRFLDRRVKVVVP